MSASTLLQTWSSKLTVPEHDGAGLPVDADLEIGPLFNVVVQELEDSVTLLLLEADDLARELAVDKQRLLSSNGVAANEGMDVLDRRATGLGTTRARVLGLLDARMEDLQGLEVGGKAGREAAICFALVDVARVAAAGGRVEQEERGQSRRLLLIRHVAVPADAIERCGERVVVVGRLVVLGLLGCAASLLATSD